MEIVETTLTSKPKNATRWSVRTIALETGVSRMTAHRVWKKYDLKPHRTKAFKISNDPQFADKVRDIVGPESTGLVCRKGSIRARVSALEGEYGEYR